MGSTPKEISEEIEAYRKLQQNEELYHMAILATFIAYQMRAKKPVSPMQLVKGGGIKPPMTEMEMENNLRVIHEKALKRMESEKNGRS